MSRKVFTILFVALPALASISFAQGKSIAWDGAEAPAFNLKDALGAIPSPAPVPAGTSAGAKKTPAPAPSCIVDYEDRSINDFKSALSVSISTPSAGAWLYAITTVETRRKQSTPSSQFSETTVRGLGDPIETSGGVPQRTPQEILAHYKDDVSKLRSAGTHALGSKSEYVYTIRPGSNCSTMDLSLIMFWIEEFFYYG